MMATDIANANRAAATTKVAGDLGLPVEDVKKPEDGDLRHWSVTTLIGALDKPALLWWSAEQAATCAVDQYKTWVAMVKSAGRDEAIKWLTGARFRTPQGELGAAQVGTCVHAAIETYTLRGLRPDAKALADIVRGNGGAKFEDDAIAGQVALVDSMVTQFEEWAQTFQPEYLATEVTVFAPSYGYAGTCDGFMKVDGMPVIFDYKTSKKSLTKDGKPTGPYPEVALQLAAYRYAELAAVWRPRRFESFRRRYYLLSPDERELAVPPPEVEGGLAIHITPEHCTAYPVRCDEQVFERFLFVVEAARWQFEMANQVIGFPLMKADD